MNKLSDIDIRMLGRIEGKIGINANIREINGEYYIAPEDLMDFICEMEDYTSKVEEELEDLKADMQENYEPKHINPYSYYGVNERDFH